MKALNELKEKIDSLNTKVVDMKKNLNQKTNSEINKIMEKTREMDTKEAEEKIAEFQSKIDAIFDNAVKHVVSTVLKA